MKVYVLANLSKHIHIIDVIYYRGKWVSLVHKGKRRVNYKHKRQWACRKGICHYFTMLNAIALSPITLHIIYHKMRAMIAHYLSYWSFKFLFSPLVSLKLWGCHAYSMLIYELWGAYILVIFFFIVVHPMTWWLSHWFINLWFLLLLWTMHWFVAALEKYIMFIYSYK